MAKKKWNIRSIFFEEDSTSPTAGKKPVAKVPAKAPSPASSSLSPAPAPAPPSNTPKGPVTGEVNDRFVKVLMGAMEAANLPGFDYLEYKKSLQNLKKMNFTDDVRYQTAYTAAQSMGVTPAQLVDSAQHYLNTLVKEQSKFAQALEGQRGQQVSNKQEQLKQFEVSITRQEAKIKELQEEIKKTKAQQQKLQKEISSSNSKLAQTQADFEATYKVLTGGIEQDVQKMKEYLK